MRCMTPASGKYAVFRTMVVACAVRCGVKSEKVPQLPSKSCFSKRFSPADPKQDLGISPPKLPLTLSTLLRMMSLRSKR